MTDVAEWLGEFAASLERADDQAVAQAFAPDGLWRDVLAFGWTIATHEGRPAIARLVSDPALRRRMGANAVARSRSYSWRRAMETLEGYYYEVLAGEGQ